MSARGATGPLLIPILAASAFASTFSARAVEPLVGVIARDFRSEAETIALLTAAFTLPYAFIQPILGPVGDALGKERVMKICVLVLTGAVLASIVAPNPPVLFALRILAGAAAGGIVPLSLALLGDRVELHQRQVAISRFLLAIILGQMAGSSISGILAEWIGWRGVFAVAGALITLALGATMVGFRRSEPGEGFRLGIAVARYRDIAANGQARMLFGLVFLEAIAVFGIFPYIAPLLEARGAGGPGEAGLALGGFAIGGLLYAALVRWMLVRLGLRRMLLAAAAASVLAYAAIALAGAWTLDAAAMVALGFGFYALHNSIQTQVTEVAPTARASAVALHAFFFFCGQALSVVLVGLGLSALGLVPTMAALAATILGVCLLAAWRLAPPPAPQPQPG